MLFEAAIFYVRLLDVLQMAFNPIVAIRLAPYYAGLTGWPDYFWKAFGVLGFPKPCRSSWWQVFG